MSSEHVIAASGGTTAQSAAERRWAHRKTCGYKAMITRPGTGANISCRIVNMSTTGACLALDEADRDGGEGLHLPAYFTLAMRTDRMEIDSAIVWRKGAQLGVRFLAAPRPMAKPKGDC